MSTWAKRSLSLREIPSSVTANPTFVGCRASPTPVGAGGDLYSDREKQPLSYFTSRHFLRGDINTSYFLKKPCSFFRFRAILSMLIGVKAKEAMDTIIDTRQFPKEMREENLHPEGEHNPKTGKKKTNLLLWILLILIGGAVLFYYFGMKKTGLQKGTISPDQKTKTIERVVPELPKAIPQTQEEIIRNYF